MGLFTCRNEQPTQPQNCEWCGDKAINRERYSCIGTYCAQCHDFADYISRGRPMHDDVYAIHEARTINGIEWFKRARDKYLAQQSIERYEAQQKQLKAKQQKAREMKRKYP